MSTNKSKKDLIDEGRPYCKEDRLLERHHKESHAKPATTYDGYKKLHTFTEIKWG